MIVLRPYNKQYRTS